MTQNQQILDYLMAGNTITPLEALERFGCFSLAARVYELKNTHGKPIQSKLIELPNGKRCAQYWLDRDYIASLKDQMGVNGNQRFGNRLGNI